MTSDQAMRKVLRCLRMSKASNPHEAAAALRQARALMKKFGLTESDAAASEITSADAPTRSRGGMVPNSVAVLAAIIAEGYRCEVLIKRVRDHAGRGSTRIAFHGLSSDAQVSAYAFTVLRRQLDADKSVHLKNEERRRRRRYTQAKRSQLGELFAMGWAYAVRDLFPRAEVSDAHQQALQTAIAKLTPNKVGLGSKTKKPETSDEISMQVAGVLAGTNAKLHRGVGGNDRQPSQPSLLGAMALEHQA